MILLMFALGLEFSLRKLVRVGPTAGVVAVIQCSLMIWLGYVTGRLFGFTALESLFTGALVAISSTTIIVKAFAEQKRERQDCRFRLRHPDRRGSDRHPAAGRPHPGGHRRGALAPARSRGRWPSWGPSWSECWWSASWWSPGSSGSSSRSGSDETTVVATVGICFACALLARKFGYSVALGAFLGGALVAESGEVKNIERMHGADPRPVRRHLLRVGGHADRSGAGRSDTGRRFWS